MELKDVLDLKQLQGMQDNFAEISGVRATVIGKNGEYLTSDNGIQAEDDNFSMDVYLKDEKIATVFAEKSSDKKVMRAAQMFGGLVNYFVNVEHTNSRFDGKFDSVRDDIKKSGQLVQTINEKTGHLKGIAKKQTILSLNATIEAARSGEAGVGFAVVAKSMQDLSNQSAGIYNDIETSVEEITNLINTIIEALE